MDEQISIIIPDNWSDVKIGQFQEFMSVYNSEMEANKKNLELLSIITDTDIEQLRKLPFRYIRDIEHNLKGLEQTPNEKFKHKLTIDGIDFGFQVNLHKLTLGEWIDLEHFVGQGVIENLHKICGILYRPIIKAETEIYNYELLDYENVDLDKVSVYFQNNVSVDDVYGIVVFFCHIVEGSLHNLKVSTEKKMKKIPKKQMAEMTKKMKEMVNDPEILTKVKQSLEKNRSENGGGNSLFTHSQMETLQKMTKSIN
jgi:hypothetical protein